MIVTPSRSVMAFIYADRVAIGALFSQKALENIELGNHAKISFPVLPGRVFEAEVIRIPYAIGEGQFTATGQLPRVTTDRMGSLYPVFVSLPSDFPQEHVRLGLAADVFVHTDGAGCGRDRRRDPPVDRVVLGLRRLILVVFTNREVAPCS